MSGRFFFNYINLFDDVTAEEESLWCKMSKFQIRSSSCRELSFLSVASRWQQITPGSLGKWFSSITLLIQDNLNLKREIRSFLYGIRVDSQEHSFNFMHYFIFEMPLICIPLTMCHYVLLFVIYLFILGFDQYSPRAGNPGVWVYFGKPPLKPVWVGKLRKIPSVCYFSSQCCLSPEPKGKSLYLADWTFCHS